MIKRKKVLTGIHVDASGVTKQTCFQKPDFCRTLDPVPVVYLNKPYQLYYWNYVPKTSVNVTASQLIKHPGFIIRGPVILVEGVEEWYHFKVNRHISIVEPQLKHLYFTSHVVPKPAGRRQAETHLFARDDNDAFAARLAL